MRDLRKSVDDEVDVRLLVLGSVAVQVVARGELKQETLHAGRMSLAAGLLLAAAAVFLSWRRRLKARART